LEKKHVALPLVEGQKIVGLVTASDLLRVMEQVLCEPKGLESLVVKGEAFLASPVMQNIFFTLTEAGI
jgi:CBS domain-containing protein